MPKAIVTVAHSTPERPRKGEGDVIELADGVLQTGPTYFERDRKEAVAVPWRPPQSWNAAARADPQTVPLSPGDGPDGEAVSEPHSWRRPTPERRAPYHPPPSPREPL